MKKIKSIIVILASLAIIASILAMSINASVCYDDSATSYAYENFYIDKDCIMKGLNSIITSDGNMFMLSDYGYYSESGNVWVVFNNNGTYNCTDDEIIDVFEAPCNDAEEIFIYKTIIEHIK